MRNEKIFFLRPSKNLDDDSGNGINPPFNSCTNRGSAFRTYRQRACTIWKCPVRFLNRLQRFFSNFELSSSWHETDMFFRHSHKKAGKKRIFLLCLSCGLLVSKNYFATILHFEFVQNQLSVRSMWLVSEIRLVGLYEDK